MMVMVCDFSNAAAYLDYTQWAGMSHGNGNAMVLVMLKAKNGHY